MLKITVLSENTASGPGILGEHGLAYWIEYNGRRLLFDTGQGLCLMSNARCLGIAVPQAEAVALSHGHYDHTSGLKLLFPLLQRPRIFLHPAAFAAKYSRQKGGTLRNIGMPLSEKDLRQNGATLLASAHPAEIFPGARLTGEIPRETSFEDAGGSFFLDPQCTTPDPLADDQALLVETAEGLVVLLGCGHAGVINTLHHAGRLAPGRPILAVIGGMHLGAASADRLEQTIRAFKALRVRQVMPGHCTGMAASCALMQAFGPDCRPLAAGAVISFR